MPHTQQITRRNFLAAGAAAVAGAQLVGPSRLFASPLGLPLGLQLYSVRDEMAKDYEGTLKTVGALGYREVEAAGFFGRTPTQVRAAMDAAGLRCVGSHYSWNALSETPDSADKAIEFCKAAGIRYVICAFPGIKDPSRLPEKSYVAMVKAFNLEDWRWNAENFNRLGAKVKEAGLIFGYHNHTMEFRPQTDASGNHVIPYDELVRLTDPALVTLELDCGWVTVGGGDPIAYLRKYPERITLLHIKDFKATDKPASIVDPPPPAELGRGTINFRPIFEAAKRSGHIRHYYVEQEGFNMPWAEALKVDAEYMQRLTV